MYYVATIQVDQSRFVTRITDLFIADSASGPVLISATYLGGGLAGFAINDATLPVTTGELWDYAGFFRHMGDPAVQPVIVGDGDSVTLTGLSPGVHFHLPLLEGGGFGDLQPLYESTPLPGDLTQLGQIHIGAQTFVYAARRGDVEFSIFREAADGSLIRLGQSNMPLARTMPDASLDKMLCVQMNGQPVLIAISGQGNFISSQRIDTQGGIIRADYLKVSDGTGFNVPKDVAAVTVDGQIYLIVTSAMASSITTIRLLPNGSMIPVDHIVDELTTRFQYATALATAEVDGRAYVFVGGMDDGVSMFTVLPDGRLLHLETLVDDGQMTLADVSALAATVVDGQIVLFVASAGESGITQLAIDPGQIGLTGKAGSGIVQGTAGNDMLRAGRGTTQMIGGDGDDVLISYRESLMLWGGAGHDLFVATPLEGRILIWDFNPAEDSLDLSQLGMIRSIAQVRLVPFSKGIRLWFGDTLIEMHSSHGGTISASTFSNMIFPVAHYTPPYVDTIVVGSARNDLLAAARGGSEVYGMGGHDVILGSVVEDILQGGEGNDTISAGLSDDSVQGGAGDDRVRGSGGDDLIGGNTGHDMLMGESGNDFLRGDEGNDTLFGGIGNDVLSGGAGHDYLSGDAGDDLLQGWAGNDSMSGGDGNDRLIGASGDNLMSGGAGDDTLTAVGGTDRLTGGSGRDLLQSGGGNDIIDGGDDDDRIIAAAGNDRIKGGNGHDSIRGDGGNDLIQADAGDDTVDGGLDHDTVFAGVGNDQVVGGAGDDVLYGGQGDDTLWGSDGNDLIQSGFGNDLVYGGTGDDTLVGIAGENRLEGGEGNDLIQGDAQADQLLGGEGNDTIFGHGANDRIDGGAAQDLLMGGNGEDELAGGTGNDTLFGGEGADTLRGEADHDLLNGDTGHDLLEGGSGWDMLNGGDGDDTLDGGESADLLVGGAGADRFVFHTAADSNASEMDRIGDFQHGADLIDLTALGLQFIGDQAFSGAGQLRLSMASDHQILQADLDGDGLADLVIRVEGTVAIDQDDLLL